MKLIRINKVLVVSSALALAALSGCMSLATNSSEYTGPHEGRDLDGVHIEFDPMDLIEVAFEAVYKWWEAHKEGFSDMEPFLYKRNWREIESHIEFYADDDRLLWFEIELPPNEGEYESWSLGFDDPKTPRYAEVYLPSAYLYNIRLLLFVDLESISAEVFEARIHYPSQSMPHLIIIDE